LNATYQKAGFAMDTVAVLNTYADLMEAIKVRHRLLSRLLANPGGLPGYAVVELSQLQVRMLCEVFAIACLLAHGEVEGTRSGKLIKAYQADLIINALEKLHPAFYPIPSKQVQKGVGQFELVRIEGDFLTKEEMLKTYRSTYEHLHAGTLETLVLDKDKKKKAVVDPRPARDFARKLVTLLNHHQIYLADEPGEELARGEDGELVTKRQIIVVMQSDKDGKCHTHLFERMGRVREQ
jgi:hypothetical protein